MSVLLEITDVSSPHQNELPNEAITAIGTLAEGGLLPPLRFRSA